MVDKTKVNKIMEGQKRTKEEMLEHLYDELAPLLRMAQRFKEGWARDKRIYELMLEEDNFKKIEPTYIFETLPEYWDLKKKQFSEKYQQDNAQSEARYEGFQTEINSMLEDIRVLSEYLEKPSPEEVLGEEVIKQITEGDLNE